ncbi:amidase [Lysobacter sp. Root96]|uniref:amidase n=1 Tax=Lysobacter sp. Root96 TaxID=1736612 RepID=UPI0006FAB16F|nr:amidase [Lysobacter sp. Root96]KQZ62808.1 amidase [Lysobacter sp. Root559]KRC37231.1 amidase [Lysobacter sp. Root76]KRD67775.1 amidase [Lysobacter sp. Root96]
MPFLPRLAAPTLALVLSACAIAPAANKPIPAESATDQAVAISVVADPHGIAEADIEQLAALQRDGKLSSVQLTQAYLDRIAALDDAGPTLNAVIELNPNALLEAGRLDAERKAGKLRGPLHGIPVLIKDNIDATPMVNSAGSLALAEHRPKTDAPLVVALRSAGAVILGKTNLSEWANFRSTHSMSGWSARGGLTRNPYALDRSACGSSSGTGSAIAASLAAVGVGTETDGSILCPAAMNGLVGLKPSVGLISRAGIIPISASQDTPGPMTRSVADAARLLSVLAAADAGGDAAAKAASGHRLDDYTSALDPGALKGARIGFLHESGVGYQRELNAALERAIATLRKAGATVIDVEIPTAGQWDEAEYEVLLYEFKDGLQRYLRDSDAPLRSLDEVIAFNRAHADRELHYFGQEHFERAAKRGPLSDARYRQAAAKARRLAGAEGIDAVLKRHKLDALIAPATGPSFIVDPINGDHFNGAGYGAAAVAGYPSLTVPMGDAQGLPLGLVFMGPRWSDARLLSLGYAFEQATQARTPPRYRSTLSP